MKRTRNGSNEGEGSGNNKRKSNDGDQSIDGPCDLSIKHPRRLNNDSEGSDTSSSSSSDFSASPVIPQQNLLKAAVRQVLLMGPRPTLPVGRPTLQGSRPALLLGRPMLPVGRPTLSVRRPTLPVVPYNQWAGPYRPVNVNQKPVFGDVTSTTIGTPPPSSEVIILTDSEDSLPTESEDSDENEDQEVVPDLDPPLPPMENVEEVEEIVQEVAPALVPPPPPLADVEEVEEMVQEVVPALVPPLPIDDAEEVEDIVQEVIPALVSPPPPIGDVEEIVQEVVPALVLPSLRTGGNEDIVELRYDEDLALVTAPNPVGGLDIVELKRQIILAVVLPAPPIDGNGERVEIRQEIISASENEDTEETEDEEDEEEITEDNRQREVPSLNRYTFTAGQTDELQWNMTPSSYQSVLPTGQELTIRCNTAPPRIPHSQPAEEYESEEDEIEYLQQDMNPAQAPYHVQSQDDGVQRNVAPASVTFQETAREYESEDDEGEEIQQVMTPSFNPYNLPAEQGGCYHRNIAPAHYTYNLPPGQGNEMGRNMVPAGIPYMLPPNQAEEMAAARVSYHLPTGEESESEEVEFEETQQYMIPTQAPYRLTAVQDDGMLRNMAPASVRYQVPVREYESEDDEVEEMQQDITPSHQPYFSSSGQDEGDRWNRTVARGPFNLQAGQGNEMRQDMTSYHVPIGEENEREEVRYEETSQDTDPVPSQICHFVVPALVSYVLPTNLLGETRQNMNTVYAPYYLPSGNQHQIEEIQRDIAPAQVQHYLPSVERQVMHPNYDPPLHTVRQQEERPPTTTVSLAPAIWHAASNSNMAALVISELDNYYRNRCAARAGNAATAARIKRNVQRPRFRSLTNH